MTFLIKLWIFEIDFGTIVSFIFGILIGAILMCLIYAIMVLISLKDKKYAVKVQANDLSANEAEEMIHIAWDTFKNSDLRGDLSQTQHLKNVCTDLVYGIASRFYPDSKHPLLELSIDECLELIGYVQEELNKILDKKILKIFKKFKASDIYNMTKATTAVVDSKAFEVTKNVGKAVSFAKKIANAVNPVWWFKKISSDVILDLVLKKLYIIAIGILGEQAFIIYSKSFKNEAESIDAGLGEILIDLDNEIKTEITKAKNEGKEQNALVVTQSSSVGRLKQKYYQPSGIRESYIPIYDRSRRLKKKDEPKCELAIVETGLAVRED